MLVSQCINWLVDYGIVNGLVEKEDRVYKINRILDVMQLDELSEDSYNQADYVFDEENLEKVLKILTDDAISRNVIEDSITFKDLFDTKLCGEITPLPSVVIKRFNELATKSGEKATDYFYELSKKVNYIRTQRVKKDLKWKYESEYGLIDISINLSKPEKDPKAIALAGKSKSSAYPKCQLCVENEGYSGRMNHPARENLRIIPLRMNNEEWGLQYSPYVYYNEHCIVLNKAHTPMKIDKATFRKLLDFVEQFPHYLLGSNADLPIVGGSILSHDHFQGGHYEFPMAKAEYEFEFSLKGFEDVKAGVVKWPMSVIRLKSASKERLIELSDIILGKWRSYSDEENGIFAYTNGEPHNTITPIARMRDGKFELDLVLRNNLTTEEHPLGVYHPHADLHHIKKENIGLIEVMGLAILPSRLKDELSEIEALLVKGEKIQKGSKLEIHNEWFDDIKKRYKDINEANVHQIIEQEVGKVFVRVLQDAGVYKTTSEGRDAFRKFIEAVNTEN
ncbi:MAG: UDP-glucose--hexose-1-phosphate uridylyltransferase [Lachnospiraceae bacterium]|nr:UDP-glucose--hexose-1-phosphate uridylyltransferase [Lachnospiraceae bacterium]